MDDNGAGSEGNIVGKLKWTISHCNQSVPYYQKLLEPHIVDGINLSDIFRVFGIAYADYLEFPDNQKNDPFRILAYPFYNMEKIVYDQNNHYVVGFSSGDIYCLGKISEELLTYVGIKKFDTVLIQQGFDGIELGLKNLDVNTVVSDSADIILELMSQVRAVIGDGNFIKKLIDNRLISRDTIIITNHSFVHECKFENSFYKIIDIGFGLGSGVGIINCKSGEVYFAEEYYYVEWEKFEDNRRKLIVTTLTMEATPLLRYKTNWFYEDKHFYYLT